jgi:hypothetical protein
MALVVLAMVAFVFLVDRVMAAPPAFETIVLFGLVMAAGLDWQARRPTG